MDTGNIWDSFYMDQLIGSQLNGLGTNPFQTSPWQYGLMSDSAFADTLQTWKYAGFTDTFNKALTKYMESAPKGSGQDIGDVNGNMDVSTHEGNVLQLGYGKALVYLPEEQKLMIVKASETAGNTEESTARKDRASGKNRETAGNAAKSEAAADTKTEAKKKAKAAAAYRRTMASRRQDRSAAEYIPEAQYPFSFKSLTKFT